LGRLREDRVRELPDEIAKAAERAVGMAADRGGGLLDYSEASITVVEEIVAEAAGYELSQAERQRLAEDFGSYILEVARRTYGGRYLWYQDREPVLMVGDEESHVAIATWGKVQGRLSGDEADNIPYFYDGFAERVKAGPPGKRVLYV
jgi:hypothetical protein